MKPASARGQGLKGNPVLRVRCCLPSITPTPLATLCKDLRSRFRVGPAVRRGEIILKIDHLHHDQRGGRMMASSALPVSSWDWS